MEENGKTFAVQLETDPLLRLGDKYVLFLDDCATSASVTSADTTCVGGRGGSQLAVVANGTVEGRTDRDIWTEAHRGESVSEFKAKIAVAASSTP